MSKYNAIQYAKDYVESAVCSEEGEEFAKSVFDSTKYVLSMLNEEINCNRDTWKKELERGIALQDTKNLSAEIQKAVHSYLLAFSSNIASGHKGVIEIEDILHSLHIPLVFEDWQSHEIAYILKEDVLSKIIDQELDCRSELLKAIGSMEYPVWVDLSGTSLDKSGAIVTAKFDEEQKIFYMISYSFDKGRLFCNPIDYTVHVFVLPVDGTDDDIFSLYKANHSTLFSFILFKVFLSISIGESSVCKTKKQDDAYIPLKEGATTKYKYSELDMADIVVAQ